MAYTPRPHISMALQHLRFGVTASAALLALCIVTQVVVWSIVHFTDARLVHIAPTGPEADWEVVRRQAAEGEGAAAAPRVTAPVIRPPADLSTGEDPNLVPGAADVRLSRAVGIVQAFGVLSAVVFCLMMFQSVLIAGGAAIPGVERIVTAGTWAVVITLLCLPLTRLLPSIPFGGVFRGYEELVRASQAYRAGAPGGPGPIGFFAWNLGVPLAMLAGIGLVLWRFRCGVEAGIIVTNVSQLDEKLEREIRAMRLGQLSAPRAMGALNSALGDATGAYAPVQEAPRVPQQPMRPLGAPTAFMPEDDAGRAGRAQSPLHAVTAGGMGEQGRRPI